MTTEEKLREDIENRLLVNQREQVNLREARRALVHARVSVKAADKEANRKYKIRVKKG